MDYLLFLTGLFLLTAGVACFFYFREDRLFSRWLLLAVALGVLGLKVWYGMVVFALGLYESATFVHSILSALYATSLLGFCLSPIVQGSKAARILKLAAMGSLFALTFRTGVANPNAAALITLLLVLTFAGAWKIAKFSQARPWARKSIHPVVSTLLLTVIVAICLLPDTAAICYDIEGQGNSLVRILFLSALATASVFSVVFCWILWLPIYQTDQRHIPRNLVRRRRIVTSVILAAAVITCANGAWLAHWLGDQAQEKQTSTLISALRLGAHNFNASQIEQIQGNPQEVETALSALVQNRIFCRSKTGQIIA